MQRQQKYLANKNYKAFTLHPTQSLNGMLSWIDGADDPLMYTSSTWLNKKKRKGRARYCPPTRTFLSITENNYSNFKLTDNIRKRCFLQGKAKCGNYFTQLFLFWTSVHCLDFSTSLVSLEKNPTTQLDSSIPWYFLVIATINKPICINGANHECFRKLCCYDQTVDLVGRSSLRVTENSVIRHEYELLIGTNF